MSGDGLENADEEGKEHVKLQLHDITERMSKLLCHYEGDKVDEMLKNRDKPGKNLGQGEGGVEGEDEEEMKEGLMHLLTDFHDMANAKEELLGNLMNWFQGSSEILNTADHNEDPEQSWLQIEQEMGKLLSTAESFQQTSKIADIERRLLGVVLREDNIEKIEQMRDEFNGKNSKEELILEERSTLERSSKASIDRDTVSTTLVVDTEQSTVLVGDSSANGNECNPGRLDSLEKMVQVDLLEQLNVIQEVMMEIEETSSDNEETIMTNASTQTDSPIIISNSQPTKCCSNLLRPNSSIEVTENSNIDLENAFIEQIEQDNGAITKLLPTKDISYRKDSIQIDINSKIQGIAFDEVEKSCFNNSKSYISISSQVQQSKSSPTMQRVHPEIEIETPVVTITEESEAVSLLPRLRCKQKTYKNKRRKLLGGEMQDSNNLYKLNLQVGEMTRHKVYMHLPVATTCNRGLGLIPPIKGHNLRTDEGLLRTFQQGMLVFSHDNIRNSTRSYTTPVSIQLNYDGSSKIDRKKFDVKKMQFDAEGQLTQLELSHQSLNKNIINSVRKRAVTIH